MKITIFKNKRLLGPVLILIIFLGMWYFLRIPSNDRDWELDQQILPYAEFSGNKITVFNIRNFKYDSVNQYTPGYYDKTFNLDELISVDYIVEPFGSIGAAHTFVSFGFSTGDYLAISVEIRKEAGESFSPIKGLLRNYELMYVVADEQDVVKLRTNYRKNDVYLYPVNTSQEKKRQLFIDMLARVNTLKEHPEFYNTLTNTCTTNIADHVNEITPNQVPWDLRLLFPENSDALAYELGILDNSIPLEELRKKHLINEKAKKYNYSPNFSKLIRH